ncbi:FtsX-like permease family protein [Lactobacillus johnsonii]|uniref:ABC transporter permease n=1 Tax=Lactobacillus johnsonii TaxID=33959 RepID=A0A9W3SJV1_LACJH|nr:FtsX-like permease family protein [Lactobacillus johnsonii]AEB93237.1 ABC transporter permease protein [Lactobacillus johnsonii DPC 6026]AOG25596.1 ABC transporter permease [Lactobacillus johnsonii]MDY6043576.1 FtsX-like permease family protein [Lactobacillus johnsonii]QXL46792.1 FtsX-like permease family protein [Lactobacillus johnsonii]WPE31695.1 FtsX-like permease family protein [Lactobacillus johnsonii]
MNRNTLWKDALSSLNHSWGRFIGITLLMAVSAFTFIGLKMAGPDMKNTAQTYYQEVNLADLTVSSNYGLDKNDTQTIKNQAKKATLDFGYLQDATINNSKTSLRVLSESKNISTSQLISGNFPKKDNQIAISYLLRNKYHIGEWITLNEHSNLKNSRFKIVGFIRPSEYTDKSNLGQTNVGTGQLSGVAIVKKSAFKAQSYSIARIRFNKTKELDPYSSTYQKFIDNKKERLTNSLAQNSKLKKTEVDNNFKDAQKQIRQAKEQIQLAENNGLNMSREKARLEKQQKKLNEQEQEIKQLGSISYYVNDRKNDSGYDTYQSNSEKIELITNIFPVFLFAVAALVSFSTMTRFIDEERQNIGVLRALGYSKLDTSLKFVIYSLTAALTGVFIGAIGGYWILPRIIFNAYTANLTLTNFQSGFSWKYLFLTFLISILCTTGAAVIQLFIVLRAKTSELLLPKPPKNGSRILLEKIKPFWQHLSFNYKVTLRNIFRYKVKMIMTILGIAGCTGLLMMGFGIRDSLAGIGQKQYSEIIKYDLIAIDKNSLSSEQSSRLNQKLSSSQVNKYLPVYFENVSKKIAGTNQDLSIIVPEKSSQISKYISLRNRSSGQKINLNSRGIVISEKLAKLLNLSIGDELSLVTTNGKKVKLPISNICEMYMGHYVLMNSNVYQKYFNKKVNSNAQLIELNNKKQTNSFANSLMKTGAVSAINLNTNNQQIIDSLIQSMNKVIFLLIGLAALLAVVVIFTLTTTNLEERMREIATLKVLGFYNNEASLYIYRETIILSIFGILIGFLIGNWLHGFIIDNLSPLNAMFRPGILFSNYLLSALIPLVITGIMAIFVNRKIKEVNMLEALKSVD